MAKTACTELNVAMQEFTDQRYETSEQHKESTYVRVVRDMKNSSVFTDILHKRNPFIQQPALSNIETGCITDTILR